MKQAEHPPVTAGANSAAEYSPAIIDQLARIDRSRSKEEMDELVFRLLSLIGEAMLSDRVFLFERLEGTAEAYCNTFEWCANGVAPQIDLDHVHLPDPIKEHIVALERRVSELEEQMHNHYGTVVPKEDIEDDADL